MPQVALKEAETMLTKLIIMAAAGEEVIITKDDGSGFKLMPFSAAPRPKFGSAAGLIKMTDDFDDQLDDFEDYMP